jgi:L-cysteate sulfo-lyase
MPRLAAWLGMDEGALFCKRDDLTGLGAGGNKVRKLEYICAAAIDNGATTLVTSGRAQSNHARLTAAAARRLGLGCRLVLGGPRPPSAAGNVALEALMGASVTWVGDVDNEELDRLVQAEAAQLTERGERAEVIPLGGSSALGARGYVDCATELLAQIPELDHVVVPLGTGGTMAGLVAALGPERVLGVDVGATTDAAERVRALVGELGFDFPRDSLRIRSDQIGSGYGAVTPGSRVALLEAARSEGIFLDPVYTAKALSGLAAARRDGSIGGGDYTVFVHTGGLPGLFGHSVIEDLEPPG